MKPTADAAQDEPELIDANGDDQVDAPADGVQPDDQEHGSEADGDAVAENDPLVLARRPTTKTTPTASAKDRTPAPKEGTESAPKEPEPRQEALDDEDDDDPLLRSKISDETWARMGHADKSAFLGLQKVAKRKAEQLRATRAEAAKAKGDAAMFEKFVSDTGMPNETYRDSVILAGMVHRRDPGAIPHIERTLKVLREAAGVPETANVAIDLDELDKAIGEAEANFDFDKAKELIAKARKKTAPPAPQQPRAAAPAPAAGTATAAAIAEHAINQSIVDYFVEQGIADKDVAPLVKRLADADPSLRKLPADQRLRALMRAHSKATAQPQRPQPRQPERPQRRQEPLRSGRHAPGTGQNQRTQDPLALARAGKFNRTG